MDKMSVRIKKHFREETMKKEKEKKRVQEGKLSETGSDQTQKIERDDGGVFKGFSRISI